MIVFDCEIANAIPDKRAAPLPDIRYCDGWGDFAGMGIACVCTLDTDTGLPRVFTGAHLSELAPYLASAYSTGGFNSRRFDSRLLAAHGIPVDPERHFDALDAIRAAQGINPDGIPPPEHRGWTLDAISEGTFGLNKSGDGAMAPVWWQQGQWGRVVDYCMRDTYLTAKLITRILAGESVTAAGKDTLHFSPREFSPVRIEPPKEINT